MERCEGSGGGLRAQFRGRFGSGAVGSCVSGQRGQKLDERAVWSEQTFGRGCPSELAARARDVHNWGGACCVREGATVLSLLRSFESLT